MVEHALAALRGGWPPVPVARDKRPLLGSGYQHLRPTEADVRAWWRRWPTANIGLLVDPAGLVVVDLDGAAAVAEAERLGYAETYTVRRGEERMHLYFCRPADLPPGRTTHRGQSRAIDVLAAGLVVAAGSRHASGDTYTVVRGLPPAAAPAWAADMLRDRGTGPTPTPMAGVAPPTADGAARERLRAALPVEVRALLDGGAPAGARSEAEWRVLRAAVRAGLDDREVLAACLAVPWVADMRPDMARWLADDLARAHAATHAVPSRPGTRRPAPAPNPWSWAPTAPTRTTR